MSKPGFNNDIRIIDYWLTTIQQFTLKGDLLLVIKMWYKGCMQEFLYNQITAITTICREIPAYTL